MYHQVLAGVTQVVVGGTSFMMVGRGVPDIKDDLGSTAGAPSIRPILQEPSSALLAPRSARDRLFH